MGLLSRYRFWKQQKEHLEKYVTDSRIPFYELSRKFLPENKDEDIVVDIGSGNGEYAEYLKLFEYNRLYLFEGNVETAKMLRERFKNVINVRLPQKLPFDDGTVSHIHTSHMIEHLYHEELYEVLKEFDRVLKIGGCIVVSTPLLHPGFYKDLSHVKPYSPDIFSKYFLNVGNQRTRDSISGNYNLCSLTYRYYRIKPGDNYNSEWSSNIFFIDVIYRQLKKIVRLIGFSKCKINGYTIILRKEES